jgi:hypothetical protein
MNDSIKNSKPLAPASTAPVASSSANIKVTPPERGTLIKKKNTAAGDPYAQPKTARPNVLGKGARNGAAYGIRVGVGAAQVAPEAGMTQSNGRLVRPAMNRQRPSFQEGMQG